MSHLDEGLLTALLDHELDEAERLAAESHLAACEECRRLLDEVKTLATEADHLVARVELPPARVAASPAAKQASRTWITPRWRAVAWAASVTLAAGLGWLASDLRYQPARETLADRPADGVGDQRLQSKPAAPTSGAAPASAAPAAPAQEDKVAPASRQEPQAVNLAQARRNAPETRRADVEVGAGTRGSVAPREGQPLAAKSAASPAPAPAALAGQSTQPANAMSAAKEKDLAGFQDAGMEEAVRTLAGSIRLLDGLQPKRIMQGSGEMLSGADPKLPVVRVVYEDPPGRELWLDQQRPSESDRDRLRAPGELLAGDTTLTRGARGSSSLRWIDEHGFRLALTGFLAVDSLHRLALRIH